MDSQLFSRAEALDNGYTPSGLASKVKRKNVIRLASGLYATASPTTADELWLRDLRLQIARSQIPTAVCGVAAALLHGLDGFELAFTTVRPLTAVTSMSGRTRASGVRRSRLFDASRIVVIDGIAVTNLVDTIADLGHYVSDDAVEIALESILRGDDPRRPQVWHRQRLAELSALKNHPASKGRAALARVLRRRGDVGPTWSGAETLAVLAMRGVGVVLTRQVRVRIYDSRRRLVYTYWLDFADVARLIAVEIDGKLGHATAVGTQRDYRRDNVLNSVFVVLRFTASEVRKDPMVMARTVQRRLAQTPPVIGPFRTERGLQVIPCEEGLDIIDPSL